MAGFAKAILITILAAVSIMLLFNMAFFFPWYLEIIDTTFQVAQLIATDNYLTYDNYHTVYDELRGKPIFRERAGADQLMIEAFHEGYRTDSAIENSIHSLEYYYALDDENAKPYVQMGNLVTVTITANYPFRMQFLGEPITLNDFPVTFSMTTVTTKHYKDLDYDYIDYGDSYDNYDYDD